MPKRKPVPVNDRNFLDLPKLHRDLLAWYDDSSRALPWRETHDPYRIWISEIMLQQTQVSTVIPYYERFLKRFPDVATLGNANLDDVLKLWEGLGYYRRARQLHAAAVKICNEHNGKFPQTFEEIRALPGIGRYTAGAIASFAYDQRQPILEANTVRLYARLLAHREPITTTASQKALWAFAEQLVPEQHPGRFNQALMELGSQVCTPREPSCLLCPLSSICRARAAGLEQTIPGKVKNLQYESVTEHALAIRDRQGRLWLRRRQPEERWAGLWDFPRYTPGSTDELGFDVEVGDRVTSLQHGVTRFRITLHLDAATPEGRAPKSSTDKAWYALTELADLPLTAPARRLANHLLAHHNISATKNASKSK